MRVLATHLREPPGGGCVVMVPFFEVIILEYQVPRVHQLDAAARTRRAIGETRYHRHKTATCVGLREKGVIGVRGKGVIGVRGKGS